MRPRPANQLFPDFADQVVSTGEVDFAVLSNATPNNRARPAILLLHGYPETRSAWHRIAPELSKTNAVIVPDLPGYGRSRVARGTANMGSKRVMAKNLHAMMHKMGHDHYIVIGHDRGGRVAYRMALDFPQNVMGLVSVTVVPTPEMWEGTSKAFGMGAWHWFMMAQPYPLPENLMSGNPRFLIDATLQKMAGNLDLIDPLALEDYRAAFDDEDVRHAICEDYRAGATTDEADDLADRNQGRKLDIPVIVLWEKGRRYGGGREPLNIWADWTDHATGQGLTGGHLLPETAAPAILQQLTAFLGQF